MKPSPKIKKLYKIFCKQHENIMIELLAEAYREGRKSEKNSKPINLNYAIKKSL